MKPGKLLLKATGIALVLCAFTAANVAYAEAKKADKGKEPEKSEASDKGHTLEQGKPHEVRLANQSNKPLTNIDIRLSGKDAADFRQSNNCGKKLEENESCSINVTFLPKSRGDKTAKIEVRTSAGEEDVALTGTGI